MFKNPLAIGSIVIILIGISGIFANVRKEDEFRNGSLVTVTIIERPNCESVYSRGGYIKVQYTDQIYVMKISAGECEELERMENENLQVKLSPDKKSVFFIDELEEIPDQIGASVFLSAIGIFCLIKSVRRTKLYNK